MLFQNDSAFNELPDYQHYACRFDDLASSLEVLEGRPWTARGLMDAWIAAKKAKIITGDLNGDGDCDDPGEDVIRDDAGLIELLELPLRVVPIEVLNMPTCTDENKIIRVAPSALPLDPKRYWVLERWFWRQTHFVRGDGTGKAKPFYDSIAGGSLTRKNGVIRDLRVYIITV
jgi:hypothetical protein